MTPHHTYPKPNNGTGYGHVYCRVNEISLYRRLEDGRIHATHPDNTIHLNSFSTKPVRYTPHNNGHH